MSRLRAYAQLVRLPNVFTAWADILLGVLVTFAYPASWIADVPWLSAVLLLAASACLYGAGMVWNDYFDVEQDRRERPFRPIPSGRINRRSAAVLGTRLLAFGMLFSLLAGFCGPGERWLPFAVSWILEGFIYLYDARLKRTWIGPMCMGACRFLNVFLGLSLAPALDWRRNIHLALVVGVYIVGVTWFARTEAKMSSRSALGAAAGVMFMAVLLALPLPVDLSPGVSSPLFPYLLVGLGFVVGIPIYHAMKRPTPATVQTAVKSAIMGLILLDAALATAFAGAVGLMILVLLLPALLLGRWIYST